MKTKYYITTVFWVFILWIASSSGILQGLMSISGIWEGTFMHQFKIQIIFSDSGSGITAGMIHMYDGVTRIQDDKITEIEINEGDRLTFYIPDKETRFEGRIKGISDEILGEFIFPDGSRHPLQMYRKGNESSVTQVSDVDNKILLEREYRPEQLKEDVFFLRENLSSTHPQYNLYTSNEGFEAEYESLINYLDRDLTIREFYILIAPVVAKVGCSHTGIKVPEEYQNLQKRFGHYFPLRLYFEEHRVWVVSNDQLMNQIPLGSEVISIDHISVENIIEGLLSFIPSEGFNITTKYHELNKRYFEYYNFINDAETIQIEYTKPGNQVVSSTIIRAVPYKTIAETNGDAGNTTSVEYSMDQNTGIAILTIRSFAIRDISRFIEVMDSVFLEIKKLGITNLILDVRGNQGGHPIFAAILFSYLVQHDFTYFSNETRIPEFEPLYNPMSPNENSFSGNCYVLVDGGCLSTTGHLISLLRYHKRAVFLGEEPGSWFYCNDNSKRISLPNTLMDVNIPQTTFQTHVTGYNIGDPFEVDYPIPTSVNDLIENKDTYTEYTMSLINKSAENDGNRGSQ